jgi:dephospho-CoA kinase
MKGRIFGLTGGIASGKSTVSKLFQRDNIPMVDADEAARAVVAPGKPALRDLVHVFGSQILLEDGKLNRPRLAALIFMDPKKRCALDQIIEGYLMMEINTRLKKAVEGHSLVGFDAALIIEKGHEKEYRPLVVVAATPEVQLQRLQSRDGFNEAEAKARLEAQLPISEKVKLADYVIWNNGTVEELEKQAISVLVRLRNP